MKIKNLFIYIMLSTAQIVIIIAIIGVCIWYFMDNKRDTFEEDNIEHMESLNEEVISDPFWSRVVLLRNSNDVIYNYDLPGNFNINPKYLKLHPSFSVTPDRTIQIVSDNEGEAVAMLSLWVSLNLGLLDNEQEFSKLFQISLERARNYPSVSNKFKQDIVNMLYSVSDKNEEKLDFTQDLALSEVRYQNPPVERQGLPPPIETRPQRQEINLEYKAEIPFNQQDTYIRPDNQPPPPEIIQQSDFTALNSSGMEGGFAPF